MVTNKRRMSANITPEEPDHCIMRKKREEPMIIGFIGHPQDVYETTSRCGQPLGSRLAPAGLLV